MVYDFLKKNKELSTYAVICGEDRISYSELYKKSNVLGKKISDEMSDVVIIFMPNSTYYMVSYFAILSCGKIAYPISSLSKPDELSSAIERTNCKCVLTVRENFEGIKAICQSKGVSIICVEEASNSTDSYDFKEVDRDEGQINDTCLLLNTSGSTDKHKIVMLTQGGIVTNCNDWVDCALDPSVHSNILISMPASTSFGSIVTTTCILLGWTIVFMPEIFNVYTLLQTIEKEKVTHLISIGTMLNILALNVEKLKQSNYDSNSLKFIGIGGNGAVPETMKILMGYFKEAGMSPGYGITEATCMVATIPPKTSIENKELFFSKINSAGKPFKHSNIVIFNDGEYTRSPNVTGEILISGPILMKGYFNNKEATESALRNGYLHTGDIGYFDEDGYLYIVGRVKNIIKCGGYSVFPEEIESVIVNSGMASEAYVYGIPDSILDEIIIADVIPINGQISVLDIEKYCRGHLANYKLPKKIRFVSSIQKTSNGKIQRKVLIGDKK